MRVTNTSGLGMIDMSRMASELSLTEAETGQVIQVRRSDIKQIMPCYAAPSQYGLYRHAYGPGLEKDVAIWTVFPRTNLDMCQIEWKSRKPHTFVLHPIQELALGVGNLHMNPLLLRRFEREVDAIAARIEQGSGQDIIHIPRHFGTAAAVGFADPGFTTFPATIERIRKALADKLPLGTLEAVPASPLADLYTIPRLPTDTAPRAGL